MLWSKKNLLVFRVNFFSWALSDSFGIYWYRVTNFISGAIHILRHHKMALTTHRRSFLWPEPHLFLVSLSWFLRYLILSLTIFLSRFLFWAKQTHLYSVCSSIHYIIFKNSSQVMLRFTWFFKIWASWFWYKDFLKKRINVRSLGRA